MSGTNNEITYDQAIGEVSKELLDGINNGNTVIYRS